MNSGVIRFAYVLVAIVPLYGCGDTLCRLNPQRSEDSCRPKEEDESYTPPAPGQLRVNCSTDDLGSDPQKDHHLSLVIQFEPTELRRFHCYQDVLDDATRVKLDTSGENFADQKCVLPQLLAPLSGSATMWYDEDPERGFYEHYEGETLKASGEMECYVTDTR